MNTADFVDSYIKHLKDQGCVLSEIAWKTALACVGWAYVFGARGQYCTPANRRSRYNGTSAGKDKDNIKDKCKNFSGDGTCKACQWYPNNSRTRIFDCRGFTYWVLLKVYGWELVGAGCTSQWDRSSNWKAKGKIADGIPENTLVCLFYPNKAKPSVMEHTGFGYNGQTVECSGKVFHKDTMDRKWTHWAVPACIEGDIPMGKPTLRKGDKGEYVTLMQTKLIQLGYDLSPFGADGKFGAKTETALKQFQKDSGLDPDGICGKKTWEALDSGDVTYYTVTINHVSKSVAEGIVSKYGGSMKAEE